jgi:hypothetical protein
MTPAMQAAEAALANFPANRAVGDEHVVARWCGRDITAAHFRLAAEALALIRAEAAAKPPAKRRQDEIDRLTAELVEADERMALLYVEIDQEPPFPREWDDPK